MMVNENRYHYDVFISYAHADDLVISGNKWIDRFTEYLHKAIHVISGHAPKIFYGGLHYEPSNDIDQHLQEVSKSKLFLAIVSPNYVTSRWCESEVLAFLNFHLDTSRILVVELLPLRDNQALPGALADLIRFRFWRRDGNSGAAMTIAPGKNAFQEAVFDLATLIVDSLEKMEDAPPRMAGSHLEPTAGSPPSSLKPLLVACGSDDVRGEREELIQFLQQSGAEVIRLPDESPGTAADLDAMLEQAFARAALFVQLLGPRNSAPLDGAAESADERQWAAARRRLGGENIFLWRSPEVDPERNPDEGYKALLRIAESSPLLEFAQRVLARLKAVSSLPGASTAPPPPASAAIKARATRPRTKAVDKDKPPHSAASGDAKETASPATKSHDPSSDRYRTQTDDPSRADALERKPFAAVLARRIVEVRESQRERDRGDERAFMVHLHGPWGSGKSSMLNLLQEELEDPQGGTRPSLVVWFNAWKHQRMRPPWWALLTAIYGAAVGCSYESPNGEKAKRTRRALRRLWWRWRLRADLLPGLLIGLLFGAVAFMFVRGNSSGLTEGLLQIVVPVLAAAATLVGYAKLIAFGSDKAAKTYADLTADPFGPVVRLFRNLVHRIPRPLVIFIEDLDRCESDYVVELLEGIQTLFREAEVTYVVAAERKWICTSFDKKYGDFCGTIGEPCRPLGYLFVDKIFQISAGMPRLTRELQARYLAALLTEGEPAIAEPSAEVTEAAAERVRHLTDEAAIQVAIAETKDAPVAEQRALRAAAALQMTSAEAERATEHRLQKFAPLLEPNPRSMKRLVNAVGMAQARGILEGRSASPEIRARWEIISLRWPVLADFIADNPEAIRLWSAPGKKAHDSPALREADWPEAIRELRGNRNLLAVVGGARDEGALSPESLADLLG